MTDPLKHFLKEMQKPASRSKMHDIFNSFGLAQNPFPPNRMIVSQVIYGQDESVTRFLTTTVDIFKSNKPQRRAIAIVAGTGGGKTHFLQYCRQAFPQVANTFGQVFVLSEFQAGSGKMLDLIRSILRDTDELCKEKNGCDFLTAIIQELNSQCAIELLDELRIVEIATCLKTLMRAYRPSTKGDSSFDLVLSIARKWINAETLSQTEKRKLGVMSRISTSALAVKVLRELFSLARKLQLFQGLLLCLDEIETLFTRGLSLSQVQNFLAELRYFYDESVREDEGFDLMLLTASTTTGASNLQKVNQPIFQRFGYEKEVRLLLNQITSVGDAVEFAYNYVDYFNARWKQSNKGKPEHEPRTIVSPKEIENAFVMASGGGPMAAPGSLLDILYNTVQEKYGLASQGAS